MGKDKPSQPKPVGSGAPTPAAPTAKPDAKGKKK